MIILDTNVVSETLKPGPNSAVLAWLDLQSRQALFLTSITVAELLEGVERMPMGQRRAALQLAITKDVLPLFEGRVLSFDRLAALAWPTLNAKARLAGRAVSFADGQIAAIAACHGFVVATRDVSPFEAVGVVVINHLEWLNLNSAVDRLFPLGNPDEYSLFNTRPPSPLG
jgi:toxin FitB